VQQQAQRHLGFIEQRLSLRDAGQRTTKHPEGTHTHTHTHTGAGINQRLRWSEGEKTASVSFLRGIEQTAAAVRGLLRVAVDLLQVLLEAGRGGRDGGRGQQVPLLQQVHHPQGLRGAGLEAQGRQGRAQPRAAVWLRDGGKKRCT